MTRRECDSHRGARTRERRTHTVSASRRMRSRRIALRRVAVSAALLYRLIEHIFTHTRVCGD